MGTGQDLFYMDRGWITAMGHGQWATGGYIQIGEYTINICISWAVKCFYVFGGME